MTAEFHVHWWLAVEPLGDDVAWALTKVSGTDTPTGPAGGGLLTGLGEIKRLVESARPAGVGNPWSGPLTDPRREHALAVRVGAALLPPILRAGLRGAEVDRPDTLTIAVRGWLARVPWDCLAIDHSGIRLLETARILGGLPATVHVGRARLPEAAAYGPAVRVVDPGPSTSSEDNGSRDVMWKMIYPEGRPPAWNANLVGGERIVPAGGDGLTSAELSGLLRTDQPARLMYFGHAVPGTEHAPAAAGLVLTDDAGDAEVFTAFRWLKDPGEFPAPPRVAVIGCGSNDSAKAEQSGLPIAAINAGAALVTATRWILPLDPGPGGGPATALAVAVDQAHGRADPLDALRAWQLERLHRWREHGELQDTPLLWASLISYLAPTRP